MIMNPEKFDEIFSETERNEICNKIIDAMLQSLYIQNHISYEAYQNVKENLKKKGDKNGYSFLHKN